MATPSTHNIDHGTASYDRDLRYPPVRLFNIKGNKALMMNFALESHKTFTLYKLL